MGCSNERKFIEDPYKRSAAYRRRIQGLKKKADELSTLCEVSTLLICFGPKGKINMWPERREDVRKIVHKYNLSKISKGFDRAQSNQAGSSPSQMRKNENQSTDSLLDALVEVKSEEALTELIRSMDLKIEETHERMRLLTNRSSMELNSSEDRTNCQSSASVDYNWHARVGPYNELMMALYPFMPQVEHKDVPFSPPAERTVCPQIGPADCSHDVDFVIPCNQVEWYTDFLRSKPAIHELAYEDLPWSFDVSIFNAEPYAAELPELPLAYETFHAYNFLG